MVVGHKTAFSSESNKGINSREHRNAGILLGDRSLFYFDRIKKGQRAVGQLEMRKIFGKVPWGQHIDIVSRCQLIDEAMFYVNNVVNIGWSRPALNANIDANLFQSKGMAVTNFKKALPSSQEKIARKIHSHLIITDCQISNPSDFTLSWTHYLVLMLSSSR